MEFIFILGTSQAIFLALLAFFLKNKSPGDYVLASWMVFMGLHILYYYLRTTGIIFRLPLLCHLTVELSRRSVARALPSCK